MVADDNINYLRNFIMCSLHYLIKRMREIGTTDRHPGSGRPCTLHVAENIGAANDLMRSQNGASGIQGQPKLPVRSPGKLAFRGGQWDASYTKTLS